MNKSKDGDADHYAENLASGMLFRVAAVVGPKAGPGQGWMG